jgi:hypothetical protein
MAEDLTSQVHPALPRSLGTLDVDHDQQTVTVADDLSCGIARQVRHVCVLLRWSAPHVAASLTRTALHIGALTIGSIAAPRRRTPRVRNRVSTSRREDNFGVRPFTKHSMRRTTPRDTRDSSYHDLLASLVEEGCLADRGVLRTLLRTSR